jgi:hypothetical protein
MAEEEVSFDLFDSTGMAVFFFFFYFILFLSCWLLFLLLQVQDEKK